MKKVINNNLLWSVDRELVKTGLNWLLQIRNAPTADVSRPSDPLQHRLCTACREILGFRYRVPDLMGVGSALVRDAENDVC